MSRTLHSRLIVLGAGPAGYTAGIYASRAMLEPMIISGSQPGGQLMITTDVENFPGFAAPIQGPWLVEQMERQATALGTRVEYDLIVEADLSAGPFLLRGDSGKVFSCDALIVATGAQARWLGLPSEQRFQGFGVSACATCDGPFYKGQTVIVVGGGNTAAEEALFLANIAERVIVVHRRSTLRADRVMQERLLAHPKVTMRWHSVLTDIHGTDAPLAVTGVAIENILTGARETIDASGVFVSIGHTPATEIFAGQLAMKPGGYLRTAPGSTATSVPGVFAAGDVADDTYRQAVTAAGLGCMAALDAERFLAGLHVPQAA